MTLQSWLSGIRSLVIGKSRASRRKSQPNWTSSGAEMLEIRQVPTTAVLQAGILTITGSDQNDNIVVSKSGTKLRVSDVTTTFAASNVKSIVVNAGEGDDTVDLSAVTVSTQVFGGAGNDVLVGGSGKDSLLGEAGNDVLRGNGGNDILDGSEGLDLVQEFANANFVLTNAQLTGVGTDTLTSIEAASLQGGAGNNRLDAAQFSGSATLDGAAGKDTLSGSSSADSLIGGAGNDSLIGNAGDDVLEGGDGDDQFNGGEGDDRYVFAHAAPFGKDTITDNGLGMDVVDFSRLASAVTFDLSYSSDQWIGNQGRIRLATGSSVRGVVGSAAADVLIGNLLDNLIAGNGGNDTINASAGNDTVFGGNGSDLIYAGDGDDLVFGDLNEGGRTAQPFYPFDDYLNRDTVFGGNGNDSLSGDDGDDIVNGESGNDSCFGSEGNDTLTGQTDNDLLNGGNGNDSLSGGEDSDSLLGANGADTLDGGPAIDYYDERPFEGLPMIPVVVPINPGLPPENIGPIPLPTLVENPIETTPPSGGTSSGGNSGSGGSSSGGNSGFGSIPSNWREKVDQINRSFNQFANNIKSLYQLIEWRNPTPILFIWVGYGFKNNIAQFRSYVGKNIGNDPLSQQYLAKPLYQICDRLDAFGDWLIGRANQFNVKPQPGNSSGGLTMIDG